MEEIKVALPTLDAKGDKFSSHTLPAIQRVSQVNSTVPWHPNFLDQIHQLKSMRWDVPRFSGKNPAAWVSEMQRYFDFFNTPDQQRLIIASYYLDEDALVWYNWMRENQFIPCWTEFMLALENRFSSLGNDDSIVKSDKLILVGTLDYHHLFDQLSPKNIGVPEPATCFTDASRTTTQEEKHDTSTEAENSEEDFKNVVAIDKEDGLILGGLKSIGDSPHLLLEQHLPPSAHTYTKDINQFNSTRLDVSRFYGEISSTYSNQMQQITKANPLDTMLSEEEKYYQIMPDAWKQIVLLKGEQLGQRTSNYFLVSATVALFNGPDFVPIFSLPTASIANHPMLTLLAISNFQQINQRDREVSLKYWFSGTGFHWKKLLGKSLLTFGAHTPTSTLRTRCFSTRSKMIRLSTNE